MTTLDENEQSSFYFEYLSSRRFLSLILFNKTFRKSLTLKTDIYFIDESYFSSLCFRRIINSIFNIYITKLKFKLKDLKDSRGENLQYRFLQKDLYKMLDIFEENQFVSGLDNSIDNYIDSSFKQYIKKSIIGNSILLKDNIARKIYLINVINLLQPSEASNSFLILQSNAWLSELNNYSKIFNIKVISTKFNINPLNFLINLKYFLRYKNSNIYLVLRSLKTYGFNSLINNKQKSQSASLYMESRGKIRLINDGYHSDFFWIINSCFNPSDLTFTCFNNSEKKLLFENDYKIASISLLNSFYTPKILNLNNSCLPLLRDEKLLVQNLLNQYNSLVKYWYVFFSQNNIKVFLTWYLFGKTTYPQNKAIELLNGVSVYLPVAFNSFRNFGYLSRFDISFCFSAHNATVDKASGLISDYRIITGYPRDYAPKFLKEEAISIRDRLKSFGAKKIVCVLDENSLDDDRWHTGHDLQKENYKYILNEVMNNEWLGVIFKPKNFRTLKSRIEEVYDLLQRAESTGRCFVYRDIGRLVPGAPPLLAALSSDICINSDLTGTGGFECAVAGVRTIALDREGNPDYFLYNQATNPNNLIFKDWKSAIASTKDYLKSTNKNSDFGDWSSVLDEIDPFRDGLAAKRIGDYLNSLLFGFSQGKTKDHIIEEVSEKYASRWGKDKVIRY